LCAIHGQLCMRFPQSGCPACLALHCASSHAKFLPLLSMVLLSRPRCLPVQLHCHVDTLMQDQMDSLPYLCRFQYSETAEYLTSLSDPLIAAYRSVGTSTAGALWHRDTLLNTALGALCYAWQQTPAFLPCSTAHRSSCCGVLSAEVLESASCRPGLEAAGDVGGPVDVAGTHHWSCGSGAHEHYRCGYSAADVLCCLVPSGI
jgi:hypothetical protein